MHNRARGVELLSVAIDFQGVDKARPYVERAQATYRTVVDTENRLGECFGFNLVPNLVFVDDAGIIRYIKSAGFDIRDANVRRFVERFVESPDVAQLERRSEQGAGFEYPETRAHFRRGLACYRQGDVGAALAAWRAGAALEPENWIIRKQVWAIEHPERFYEGEVDFDWQAEQIEAGR